MLTTDSVIVTFIKFSLNIYISLANLTSDTVQYITKPRNHTNFILFE